MPATIINLSPCEFDEFKPSLIPNRFLIPACKDVKEPVLFHVQDGVRTFEYIDELRKNKVYPIETNKLAEALVNDVKNTIFGKNNEQKAFPGLGWLVGEVDKDTLFKKHKAVYDNLIKEQNNWFQHLVLIADDDWQKFHQHKMITQLSINAAKALGLKREWIMSFDDTARQCPFCQSFVNTYAIKCPQCNEIIDMVKYTEMKTMQEKANTVMAGGTGAK